jgi:hypothetical protein
VPFWGGLGWWYSDCVAGDVFPEYAPFDDEDPDAGEEAPESAGSRLIFDVEPEDAVVYVDGRLLGTADQVGGSLRGVPVEPGRHTLDVLRPGYRGWSKEIEIGPGATRSVGITLEE